MPFDYPNDLAPPQWPTLPHSSAFLGAPGLLSAYFTPGPWTHPRNHGLYRTPIWPENILFAPFRPQTTLPTSSEFELTFWKKRCIFAMYYSEFELTFEWLGAILRCITSISELPFLNGGAILQVMSKFELHLSKQLQFFDVSLSNLNLFFEWIGDMEHIWNIYCMNKCNLST